MTKLQTQNKMKPVLDRLAEAGFRQSFVRRVVLPEWWDDEIALDEAGFQQGLGIIARHLGLELNPLFKGHVEFRRLGSVHFKKSADVSDAELSVAQSVATQALWLTCSQTRKPFQRISESAAAIRHEIIGQGADAVNLENLLDYCWRNGVVVLHLSHFPSGARKMDGLVTIHEGRPGIVLCQNRQSPAWMVFHLAHELGHIARGHLKDRSVLVDQTVNPQSKDREEVEANRFAVELLTGDPNMQFKAPYFMKAEQLADAAKSVGRRVRVDAGVVALNYAWHSERKVFALANAALKKIEGARSAVEIVRKGMVAGLNWDEIPEANREYLRKVTGASIPA